MATKHERSSSPKSSQGARRPHDIVSAVRPLAERLVAEHDLVLWGVTFVREAGRDTLRVACDRAGGVTADNLAAVSEVLSREIDRTDVVAGDARYVLEVTSPGAERKLETLEQFQICTGRVAKVSLKDGRALEGPIEGVTANAVEIGGSDATVRVLFEDISKARLVVNL